MPGPVATKITIILKTVLKLAAAWNATLGVWVGEQMTMGRLTTHVLDTASGLPARGVTIDLDRIEGAHAVRIGSTITNADGRTDAPMLAGEAFAAGTYVLTFHVRDYFTARAGKADASPFLDIVPIRFVIADADKHYHVPLLVTPWSFSTYRGS